MSQVAPSPDAATILVAQPEPLRDYFLRLGAEASIADPCSVRVELAVAEGDDTIADHLRRWVEVNGIDARIATDEPVAEPQPEPKQMPVRSETFFLERPRLGDLLLKKGLITQEQLEAALTESRGTGGLLGRLVIRPPNTPIGTAAMRMPSPLGIIAAAARSKPATRRFTYGSASWSASVRASSSSKMNCRRIITRPSRSPVSRLSFRAASSCSFEIRPFFRSRSPSRGRSRKYSSDRAGTGAVAAGSAIRASIPFSSDQ